MTALEIAVTSVEGARAARAGGATRLELCSALEVGGITPSQGLLEAVLDEAGGVDSDEGWQGVHVLVRPRPGGFCYSAEEQRLYAREVETVLEAGADGVVVGALTSHGEPDLELIGRLADQAAAYGATVTFHRAVDRSADPVAAIGALAGVVDRVLTSGGAPTAAAGATTIAAMVAVGGPAVLAGGGVSVDAIEALVGLGVEGIHLSAKRRVADGNGLALGVADDGGHWITDPALVAAAAAALS
ncbi:copper homeostasis protein [Nocardioides albertanoniae]|uniref:PF03932 family protein CutC n=1 Tax=Nocardioides albertanoniae TaxID=1175486 RepID=A0A543AAM5_9ACTN|nr:copper homeostasis protein CutC [Nocardioides albertanoniae]TQL69647.1 copper homeostasis protein [Nocardioides albertanoniae]